MKFFLTISLILSTIISIGQINSNGLPIISNFTPFEYDASDQNWAAVQDHRGVMYFGNNHGGVLEYDGKTWRKIPVSQNRIVRSLAVDSLGTVYVGLQGDFGFLKPDRRGRLKFESLLNLLPDTTLSFSYIEKIHVLNKFVYFFSRSHVFIYDGTQLKALGVNPDNKYYNFYSFLVNNRYYIGSYTFGLRELVDTVVTIAPNGDFFVKRNIISILPYKNNWVDVVCSRGLYRYNQVSGEIIDYTDNHPFYKESVSDAHTYQAIRMADSTIGLAYIIGENYSFAQIDSLGRPIRVLNKEFGLLDENVLNIHQSFDNNSVSPLWLTLDIGISRADVHSQVGRFSEEVGIRGAIQGILEYNGTLVVYTMSGVFYFEYNKDGFGYFKHISELNTAVWSHLLFKDPTTNQERLLIGAIPGGIFEIDENFRAINITNSPEFRDREFHPYSFLQSTDHPEVVFVTSGPALIKLKWENGQWKNFGRIAQRDITIETRSIVSPNPNELWLGTINRGIFRVEMSNNDTIVRHFNVDDGIPELWENFVYEFDERVFVTTTKGIYSFNKEKDTIQPAILPGLNQTVEGRGIARVAKYNNGYAFACYNTDGVRWVEIVTPQPDGTDKVIKKPFKSLPSRWAESIYTNSNGVLWIGISTELFSYNSSIKRDYNEPFNALIRKVSLGDSVLFYGAFYAEDPDGEVFVSETQQQIQTYALPFRYNNISFEVASSFYENEDATEYSWMLVGNDNDWARWTTMPSPIYTNLSEGSYVFRVKAKNIYGVESTIAEYSFSIKPPWYRTIYAYISYIILAAGFIWLIVVLNTRRLIAEKEHLEQVVKERTAEVVAQKEEIEHQRDKIFEQNEEIKSSINYASRIQTALLPPNETINEIFDDYFILFLPRDIVSGDFYWFTQVGNRKITVAADCTGHGVPGGFMSMLGMGFLTQIMAKGEKFTAAQILDQLREMIIESLHQTGKPGESKDGMDLALHIVDTDTGKVEFAGANNPLVLIRDNEIIQYKGDKMPIGIHIKHGTPFQNFEFEYKKGDVLYTFSDGFPDQFGGPDERKFMIKRLKELYLEIHQKPMQEQREILLNTLVEWQGETVRIDDIVVIGIRL